MKKPLKKVITIGLILTLMCSVFISINNFNKGSIAEAKESIESGDLLEFLKEAYNVYWFVEDSIDYGDVKVYKGKEYVRVKKNFSSSDDIQRYLDKYYTKKASGEFMEELSPMLINGELYVLIGEAGDQPIMTSGEIVDMDLDNGYVTIMAKDKGSQTLYIKANIVLEGEKLKVNSWKVL
ncbi:MAG: DL-endopeptidase inhibitor IseA family protein [Clostridium sp.]